MSLMPVFNENRRKLVCHTLMLIHLLLLSLVQLLLADSESPPHRRDPIPYHTSALSGYQWILELITGHPDRIKCELGLSRDSFLQVVLELRQAGHIDSKHVTLEEQVAIFLYTCVTGLTSRHIGERFQRSNHTISKYFNRMLVIFSSPPFYTRYVKYPTAGDSVPSKIRRNPKFYPYFRNAIGAIDGSHIPASPPARLRALYRNRKGFLSQNGLFACNFDLEFTYALTGWEGSAPDARVYKSAAADLEVPGKYLLGDAGFPRGRHILVPYRNVRYHLKEFGHGSKRPQNKEELFNLRHSSLRNAVERVFGILKRRFRILLLAPEYPIESQAKIPAALCALHNFILKHEPSSSDSDGSDDEDTDNSDDLDLENNNGVTQNDAASNGPGGPVAADDGDSDEDILRMRDEIASEMWADYQEVLRQRGLGLIDEPDGDYDDSDSD